MRAKNANASQPRSVALKPAFAAPDAIEVGSVIFDCDYEMPGTVRDVDAPFIEMVRPTGLAWRVHYRRLRPASAWEKRQLVAVGRLHKQRQKGNS